MNPIYGIGGKTLPPKCILFMDPKYIPPIHSLSKIDNANLPSSTALDYCYEALLFMTQAYETVVRVTLFKDSKTENGEFMCNCDPYLNLPCHFGITELTSMGDFVKQHIWSSICKQFSADE
uniref:SWIM-type domain-containing protein n=2 Tax=Schistosoma mansoni TaxID=6183 RepID=A0A5K4F2Q0_SCHMA